MRRRRPREERHGVLSAAIENSRIAGGEPRKLLIQINAKLGTLPSMTAGNGPDAVHFPKILK
jgi:hypothetical protein